LPPRFAGPHAARRARRGAAGVLLLLPLCVHAAGCGGGPPKPAGVFAGYPPSPALEATAKLHRDAATDRDGRMLLTTWFHHGDPRVALVCSVRPDGTGSTYRYLHEDEAIQPGHRLALVADQVAALREAIDRLPGSQSPPPENLLIVSFRRSGQWVTRTYDRTNPPPPAAELFAVTGAPIQPNPAERTGASVR
jgi:hypothetical protein